MEVKPLKMKLLALLCCFTLCTADTQYATHWVVTEKGLIKSKVESQFAMSRPYDLLAFLDQESRWYSIHSTYEDLMLRQANLEKLWAELSSDTNIMREVSFHIECHKAGKLQNLDFYASHLEDGSSKHIDPEEYKLYKPSNGQNKDVPDCKKISSLTFSMYAFEHLEAMRNRHNLTIEPELILPKIIDHHRMTLQQFGHWVATTLRKNTTSWLHYNLASLYWRVRGDALKALECSRRAAHYSNKEYEDIPLLSMGTIFLRAGKPNDANIVLRVALKNNKDCAYCHFTMANVYAMTGDFKRSLKHYDICLKLDAGLDRAIKNKFGVLCVEKVLKKMQHVYESLMKMRAGLIEYFTIEDLWIKNMTLFVKNMKHDKKNEFDYRKIALVEKKMSEITGLKIKELRQKNAQYTFIREVLQDSAFVNWKDERGVPAMESAHGFRRLVIEINRHLNMAAMFKPTTPEPDNTPEESTTHKSEDIAEDITEDIAEEAQNLYKSRYAVQLQTEESCESSSQPQKENKEPEDADFEKGPFLYQNKMKINRQSHDFDTNSDWPDEDVCVDDNLPDKINLIYPIFLPFENKGLSLKGLLTDKIGVPLQEEHELPWRPPHCSPHSGVKDTIDNLEKQISVEVSTSDHLKRYLLRYAGDGRAQRAQHMMHAEIGQRILTAMEQKVAPKWMLYTLSSLYWRVRGNNRNALSCLITAGELVTTKYKDVVFISLASVYLEMGYMEEAWKLVTENYKHSLYEPATNLLLAEMHMLKENHNTQLFHLKQVVRIAPSGSFLSGLARSLLVGWACVMKQTGMHQKSSPLSSSSEPQYCTPIEENQWMVCRRGRAHCVLSASECPLTMMRGHLPGQWPYGIYGSLFHLTIINIPNSLEVVKRGLATFSPVFLQMPAQRSDKARHEKNFALLGNIISQLSACEGFGCSKHIQSVESCRYQYLQLEYWAEGYGFWEFKRTPEFNLPTRVLQMTPSRRKIPECQVFGDVTQDFYLSRIGKVSVYDWEPTLSLMQSLLDEFDNTEEYEMLGAKISAYVDAAPRSWLGLAAAAWWCGASGRGRCCVRCIQAASSLAPTQHHHYLLRMLAVLLHLHDNHKDGRDMAYLSFYAAGPQSTIDALLVGISESYNAEYSRSNYMHLYVKALDPSFLPVNPCLHASLCLQIYGKHAIPKYEEWPDLDQ